MKHFYIKDITDNINCENQVVVSCWLKNKRVSGSITFLELEDSTGEIEAIAEKNTIEKSIYDLISTTPIESSITVHGTIQNNPKNKDRKEINISQFEIINLANRQLSPSPRLLRDPFDKKYADYILKNKHLFIRNSKISSVIKIKHKMLIYLREWLNNKKFIEVDTPILTQSNLYDSSNTFNTDYFGTKVYLSQCAGLYLGAMVPALEKVYTVTPAFRKESSKSPRHNPEFYHLKGQIAFCYLDEIMSLIEEMLYHTTCSIKKNCIDELNTLGIEIDTDMYKPPYPRIPYSDAIKILASKNIHLEPNQSLNEKAEQCIADKFNKPTFVMNVPSNLEPFPYKYAKNESFTNTADLLIPNGIGEILGVAEFIHQSDELKKRMIEKNKFSKENNLEWYKELAEFGDIPRSGFGMGVERLLRAILQLPHVRDCFPLPRLYGRKPYP